MSSSIKTSSPTTSPIVVPSSQPPATIIAILLFIISIFIYAIPLYLNHPSDNEAILDELYLIPNHNKANFPNTDVGGTSSILSLFSNDYWGRSIVSNTSHKSYRPFTVLTFRYWNNDGDVGWLRGVLPTYLFPGVWVHRMINVFLHALLSYLVGVLSTFMFSNIHDDDDDSSSSSSSSNEQSSSSRGRTTNDNHHHHHNPKKVLLQQILSSLLFALHPAHVEVVSNAANRSHLLCLIMSCLLVLPMNPDGIYDAILSTVLMFCGLLSGESAVFQVPAVIVTMTVIAWNRTKKQPNNTLFNHSTIFQSTIDSLLPRYFTILFLTTSYLICRYTANTLSISPDLMIRKAEVPFIILTDWQQQFWSYCYVVFIHVGKALFVWNFMMGTSHEYSYNCIPPISGSVYNDLRVWIMLLATTLGCLVGAIALTAIRTKQQQQQQGERTVWMIAMALSWLLTLLPISGLFTVATFVGDRHVLPLTVFVCAYSGNLLTCWIMGKSSSSDNDDDDDSNKRTNANNQLVQQRPQQQQQQQQQQQHSKRNTQTINLRRGLVVMFGLFYMGYWVVNRTTDWTNSLQLYQSGLKTCPNSAKILMHLSRRYSSSGQQQQEEENSCMDLDLALSYAQKAEQIDPHYCEVHYQIAQILHHHKTQLFLEMEHRTVQAILCPGTARKARILFNTYWQEFENLSSNNNKEEEEEEKDAAGKKRKHEYNKILQSARLSGQPQQRRRRRQQQQHHEQTFSDRKQQLEF